jgi:hypothetical protein
MLRGDVGQDRRITTSVNSHLLGRGIRSPCHVRVEAHNGDVTLSGEVQYDHQKLLAVDVAKNVEGVRRVIDQLRVLPRVDVWKAAADNAARSHAVPHPQAPPTPNTSPLGGSASTPQQGPSVK